MFCLDFPPQTVTPLSPGRGGARAGGGGCAGCLWARERYAISPLVCFKKKKLQRARRAAWWPRCAARRWRAVDRGADSAAAPSHAAGRVASSAPKQTRARGAAAAAKTSTVYFSFSSRLVSSRLVAGAHARDVRSCRRVRSAKDDSNREPVGAAAARGGKTHDAHLMEMLRRWHLLI